MSSDYPSQSSHRLRTNLNFGARLYRKITSLRPSKRPQTSPISPHPDILPPQQPPERLREFDPVAVHDPIHAYHPPHEYEPDENESSAITAPSIYDRKRFVKRVAKRGQKESSVTCREAPLYTLDSSPVENYESRDMTAERVANALERIAKQTSYFDVNVVDDDDVSPKEAIIPLIINSLQDHSRDPKVVDRGLTALRRLTVDAPCRARIGEAGGIAVIVHAMRCHSLRVRIQTQACLALANLAFRCPQNKKDFMQSNGLPVIVAALSVHKSVEHVQAWGCFAIRNLTNGIMDDEHEASVAAGAVEVLVNALEMYPKSTVVQEQSLIALTNIANASSLAMERMRAVGGLQSLIACLQNNSRSAALSEIALSCTMIMVADDTNQKIFGSDGGIEAITTILDEHRGHTGIAVKGCAAFRQLAFQKENRDLLGRCGGIRAIITAMMDTAAASAETAAVLLKALSNSTFDAMANKTLAGRLGGIEATLKLMSLEAFQGDATVIEDACRVLRNLTDGVFSNHRLLIKNRGISIVLDATRSHGRSSAGVAEHGVAIFVNLTTNRSVVAQVHEGSGDIVAVAKRLRMAHPEDVNIGKQVDDLLSILETGEEEPVSVRSSGWRDATHGTSFDPSIRQSKSLRGSLSREGDQITRLQRLRSLPLPLGRHNRV